MIYLIGGSPRCGKTKVAKALAKKTHIPWFPADYLSSIVFQYVPDKEKGSKFPLSVAPGVDNSNDRIYSKYTSEQIVDFYYIQAKSVWLGLESFIKYASHDEQDFILEGYQITPDLLLKLDENIRKNIKVIFLYKKDIKDIELGLRKNIDPADWLIKNTKNESTYIKVACMISAFGFRTLNEADKYNMPVLNMDENFDNKINEAVSLLIS